MSHNPHFETNTKGDQMLVLARNTLARQDLSRTGGMLHHTTNLHTSQRRQPVTHPALRVPSPPPLLNMSIRRRMLSCKPFTHRLMFRRHTGLKVLTRTRLRRNSPCNPRRQSLPNCSSLSSSSSSR